MSSRFWNDEERFFVGLLTAERVREITRIGANEFVFALVGAEQGIKIADLFGTEDTLDGFDHPNVFGFGVITACAVQVVTNLDCVAFDHDGSLAGY